MKIVMGVDDSKFTEDTVRAIISQRRAQNTEVLVLHVLQTVGPAPPQMGSRYAPELEAEKCAAQSLIEGIAKELRSAGFKVESRIEVGDVRESIVDAATAWNADLIVVGSHGQRGIKRLLLGSVAEFVARHATCSVEIVRTL